MKNHSASFAPFALLLCCASFAVGQANPNELLHQAARDGQLKDVQALLKEGADINCRDSDGKQALASAACGGQIEVVEFLLKKGLSVNDKDPYGGTALMSAAGCGKNDVVRLLLEKGADIEASTTSNTALTVASFEGHTDTVQLLLAKGAKMEPLGSCFPTALTSAAYGGHSEIVQILLAKGANIDMEDYERRSPLGAAAVNGHTATVQLLLASGANIDYIPSLGQTALTNAVYSGSIDTVRVLLEKGANINAKGRNGITPLMAAAVGSETSIVRLLLDKKPDLSPRTELEGFTALGRAAVSHKADTVRMLADEGANLEVLDDQGATPLVAAVCEKGPRESGESGEAYNEQITKTVKVLLEKGANIGAKNKKDDTALDCTRYMTAPELVRLLKEAGQRRNELEQIESKGPAERFAAYLDAFQKNPQSEFLRESILASVAAMQEPPAISGAAQDLFVLATKQIKDAATPAALDQPIVLLRKATDLAPWWGNAYYNLSRALEMRGQFDDALQQLKYYLELKPTEAEAREAQAHIVVIQTEQEAARKQK
jgi:serine/threonine-protein phosphatase 6 regulatory ankyrin repeat subunit B